MLIFVAIFIIGETKTLKFSGGDHMLGLKLLVFIIIFGLVIHISLLVHLGCRTQHVRELVSSLGVSETLDQTEELV